MLFDGATMPARKDLPAALHRLFDRQAINLTDLRWEYDTGELGELIGTTVHQIVPRAQADPERPRTYVAVAMIVAAAVAAWLASRLALWLEPETLTWPLPSKAPPWSARWVNSEMSRLSGIAVHMGILWGIVGGLTFGVLHVTSRRLRPGTFVGALMGTASGVLAGFASGLVYVLLKDALPLDLPEFVFNGAAAAAAGGVLVGAVAPLLGEVEASIQTTIGLVGGMISGSLGGLIYHEQLLRGLGQDRERLMLAWVVQAVVLVACLATMISVARLEPAMAPAAVET